MQISKQLAKEAGLYPRLRLLTKTEGEAPVSTGKHTVRLIKDKEVMGKDITTGKPLPKVRYLLEEKGEIKIYDTRKFSKETGELSYLVQKLAEFPENSVVILEAKKVGIKNYISVSPFNIGAEVEVDDDEEDEKGEVIEELGGLDEN